MSTKQRLFIIQVVLLIAVFAVPVLSQDSDQTAKKNFSPDQYSLLFRGAMKRPNPISILRPDNNLEILLACTNGITLEQIKASGIHCLESQLRLLTDWKLLEQDNKTYIAAIPIVGEEKVAAMRMEIRTLAKRIVSETQPNLKRLRELLNESGRSRSTYPIFIGFILHESIYGDYIARELLDSYELTVDNPNWNGIGLITYPRRDFRFGTTSMPIGKNRLFILGYKKSSGISSSILGPFSGFRTLMKFINDVKDDDKIDDQELVRIYRPYNIIDEQGKLAVTHIKKQKGDKIYDICSKMTERIKEAMIAEIGSKRLQKILGIDKTDALFVVLYYELRNAILEELETRGLTGKPLFFESPEDVTPVDIGNMIFKIIVQ